MAVRAVVGSQDAGGGAIGCTVGCGRAFADRTIRYRRLGYSGGLPSGCCAGLGAGFLVQRSCGIGLCAPPTKKEFCR